jgi:uncharacterized protein involved in response to NO
MSPIPIGEPAGAPARGLVPFALGFRPFFLLAGWAATLLLGLWLWRWQTGAGAGEYYGLIGWHGHEMLFGYTVAVIAGFLLTAVRNWTGQQTAAGAMLAGLAALWLAGRIAPLVPGLPGPAVALVDLAFLPALGAALAGPLWRGRSRINRVFLVFVAAMTLANLMVHLEAFGVSAGGAARGRQLMLDMVLALILMVGGRVMPFFTERAVPAASPRNRPVVEKAGFVLMAGLLLTELALPGGAPAGVLALTLALVQAVRVAGWHHPGVWRIPILWVLYTGYAWLVAGLALRGLAAFGLLLPTLGLHALTAGAIGVLTLGMMARVALGHTGREMRAPRAVALGFVLLNVGALFRVAAPIAWPGAYGTWVLIAGMLWNIAFLAFALVYSPVLVRPRVDGQPG